MADNYNVAIMLTAQDKTGNAVGNLNREMQTLKTNTETAGGSFGNLDGMISGALAGVTLGGFTQIVGDLANVGRQAQIAEQTFSQLAAPLGEFSDVMGTLRASTNFTITDTALEQIGSKAVLTGVANTKDELGKLVEVGSRLGTAMGMDAAAGVDNLNAAILNMSYVRLDQMGLSAAKVRSEVKLLMETGRAANEEEAFKLAVLDQGSQAIERLGDASTATAGALPQLITQLGNLKDKVGSFVLTGLEAGAQIVIIGEATAKQAADYSAAVEQHANDVQDFAQKAQDAYGESAFQVFDQEGASVSMTEFYDDATKAAGEFVKENGYAVATVDELLTRMGKDNPRYAGIRGDGGLEGLASIFTLLAQIQATEQASASALALKRDFYQEIYETQQRSYQATLAQQRADQYAGPLGNMTQAEQQLNGLVGSAKSFNGLQILTPEQFDAANDLKQQFDAAYERAKDLHDQKILPDDLFNNLKAWKDTQDGLFKQSQDMAKNYEDIAGDLDKIAGLGAKDAGDKLSQQIEDRVLAAMKAGGASDAQMASYQESTNLTNGRDNALNQAIQEGVIGTIAQVTQQLGAGAGTAATERAQNALDQLVQQGASPEQIEAAIKSGVVTGYKEVAGGGGKNFTVKPGDTISGLARQYGLTPGDLMAAFGITDPRKLQAGANYNGGGGLVVAYGADEQHSPTQGYGYTLPGTMSGASGGATGAGADMTQMATDSKTIAGNVLTQRDAWLTINGYVDTTRGNLSTMAQTDAPALSTATGQTRDALKQSADHSQRMSDLITGLTKTKQIVNVELRVTDPSGLLKAAVGLDARGMAKVVNQNGGTVPGTDGRRS